MRTETLYEADVLDERAADREVDFQWEPSIEGTMQGAPLSPILANILLDDFDKELEKRGLRFVRYEITRRNRGVSIASRYKALGWYLRGWCNYFSSVEIKTFYVNLAPVVLGLCRSDGVWNAH